MQGRVIKSTGSWYKVLTDEGLPYNCRTKGKLRLDQSKLTNPVAVGDIVQFDRDEKSDLQGVITKIEDRQNYLIRRSNKLSKQYQIIASNIDQIVLVATIAKPRTTTVFIDRILMTAEAYRIPVVLILNKRDIYTAEELEILDQYRCVYQSIGVEVIEMSAFNESDLQLLKRPIANKISLITGHSGVGKSTLLNRLNPSLGLKTGNLSKYYQRGTHNTTFAEMHSLSDNTRMIDTPGIKDFGVVEFERENISLFFPDIRKHAEGCKYNNCKHLDEPNCKVKDAIQNNAISLSRYESYLNILSTL